MFGFGIPEIITVLIVAIVLINPRDLPVILRRIGKIYGRVMRQVNGMRKTYGAFENEVKSMTDLNDLKERNE